MPARMSYHALRSSVRHLPLLLLLACTACQVPPRAASAPAASDLTITHIEFTPKLPSLHGNVQTDRYARPYIAGGSPKLTPLGSRRYLYPAEAVGDVEFAYKPDEELTFTAHIKNVGSAPAETLHVRWYVDDELVGRQSLAQTLSPGETITMSTSWRWDPACKHVTCRVLAVDGERRLTNNVATDALHAAALMIALPTTPEDAHLEERVRARVAATNDALANSVYSTAPDGCRARVRIDRFLYLEQPFTRDDVITRLIADDGLRYDQGCVILGDAAGDALDRALRELPRQIGRELGLVVWTMLDHTGSPQHVWPDTGTPVTHRSRNRAQVMYDPNADRFGEVDTAYLNSTFGKPRGYTGDFLYRVQDDILLRVTDINGRGVPGARLQIFQSGTRVEPDPRKRGSNPTYFEVLENGDFDAPLSTQPVIVGHADRFGVMRLPDRPTEAARTLNGFHRRPNAFGNIDPAGRRGLMLVRVSHQDDVAYFWLELREFVAEWYRGNRAQVVVPLHTPWSSEHAPRPSTDVHARRLAPTRVRLAWSPPAVPSSSITGYRVYIRVGDDGLLTEPWQPLMTVSAAHEEITLDLSDHLPTEDLSRFPVRIGVSTVGSHDEQSAIVWQALHRSD